MATATRSAPTPPAAAPRSRSPGPMRRLAVVAGGPVLIVASVLIALRGFAFLPLLTNQHPDILTFWLPRSCLLGDALSSGRLPLWNPFEMAGTPFLADPQSGWLDLVRMGASTAFGCGGGLRAVIVLNPILAGLGLWWFLRRERLGRVAATAGGLSLAMAMAASSIAISLPFAGTLAWTPWVLVGASGFFSARGRRRLPWLALAAVAWGQVAASHLSHGLVICTGLVTGYVVSRAIHEVRAGSLSRRNAALLGVGFLVFLPLASLAILIPRIALIQRSSLRAGYGALEGTVAGVIEVDRPIPEHGVWSAWPLALASTPGAYVGATVLLGALLAFRDRARRYLAIAAVGVAVVAYLLTLTLFVGAGWFRSLALALPFGDVYLHNPGRLRFALLLVVPLLGAMGIQSLLDRRPSFGACLRWLAVGFAAFLLFPLLASANPERLVAFGLGLGAMVVVAWALANRHRWASVALVAILAVELVGGALWSSAYRGGTVYFGLEGRDHPALVHGPLRWPQVELAEYLTPGPIAREIAARDDGRYLAWIQPQAVFNKGYLFSQSEADWPALLLGRAILFGLHDVLGYSPIQVPRYWSYIRATNQLPVFYNASVIQVPTPENVRLLGVRYLIVHVGSQALPALEGEQIAREDGYLLFELDAAEPRVSVVPRWTVVEDGAIALEAVLEPGFDPARTAVVEGDPGIAPSEAATSPGTATYAEVSPEDVRVSVETDVPAIVVIRNTWERGWEATVDGEPAPVLRADHFLQAVPVPAGTHEVRLTYREPAIGTGLAASAVVWVALGAAAAVSSVLGLRRPRRSRPALRGA